MAVPAVAVPAAAVSAVAAAAVLATTAVLTTASSTGPRGWARAEARGGTRGRMRHAEHFDNLMHECTCKCR